jgi:hypothetical protein
MTRVRRCARWPTCQPVEVELGCDLDWLTLWQCTPRCVAHASTAAGHDRFIHCSWVIFEICCIHHRRLATHMPGCPAEESFARFEREVKHIACDRTDAEALRRELGGKGFEGEAPVTGMPCLGRAWQAGSSAGSCQAGTMLQGRAGAGGHVSAGCSQAPAKPASLMQAS